VALAPSLAPAASAPVTKPDPASHETPAKPATDVAKTAAAAS